MKLGLITAVVCEIGHFIFCSRFTSSMRPSMRHTLNAFFDISRHVTSMVLPGTRVSMWGSDC